MIQAECIETTVLNEFGKNISKISSSLLKYLCF